MELARQPVGLAPSPSAARLTSKANAVRLSSKALRLSAALANTACMRVLRREDVARVPDFAGQRVRQASVTVEVLQGVSSRMVHWTFSALEFDANGFVDVERLSAQQCARVEDPFEREGSVQMPTGASLLEVAPGSLTYNCFAASRQQRWDGCLYLGFEWCDDAGKTGC